MIRILIPVLCLLMSACTAVELVQGEAPSCASIQADVTAAKVALALAPVGDDTRDTLAARLDALADLVAVACPAVTAAAGK